MLVKLKLAYLWVAKNIKWLGLGLLALLFTVVWVVLKIHKANKEAEELRQQVALLAAQVKSSYLAGKLDADKERLAQNKLEQDALITQLKDQQKKALENKLKIQGLTAEQVIAELNKIVDIAK
jgi:hypothetical protein